MGEREGPSDSTSFHVLRARTGDDSSLAWIVNRFTPLLLEQARYRIGAALRRRLEPEDLVQEVWAVALPALGGLEPREGRTTPVVLKFLSTTLLYRVNNHARKLVRSREDADPAWGALPAATRGAVTRAVGAEGHNELLSALDGLSDRDREVVVLRGIEQHSNAKAAELLGETPNAVSLRYNRAIQALRKNLSGAIFDELD